MMRLAVLGFLFSILFACNPDRHLDDIPYNPVAYPLNYPASWTPMPMPAMTVEGVALGRKLFYDAQFSKEMENWCMDCHAPEKSTFNPDIHTINTNALFAPNAPELSNMAFKSPFFWDGAQAGLEKSIVEHPGLIEFDYVINNYKFHSESRLAAILTTIQNSESYRQDFRRAFGIDERDDITDGLIANALAQFIRSMVSANSVYDRYLRGEIALPNHDSASAFRGFAMFYELPGYKDAKCSHCHATVLQTDQLFHNNGLKIEEILDGVNENGRFDVTGLQGDRYTFRTPSLRNVAATAPYMHNGQFATLKDVLAHYVSGGHNTPNQSFYLPIIAQAQLNAQDLLDIEAFLHTLTDSSFYENPEYKSPF